MICLGTPDGSCTCPFGQVLGSDGKSCNPRPMNCLSDEFSCKSGHVACIHKWMVCNGLPECQDESDELNCETPCKFHSTVHTLFVNIFPLFFTVCLYVLWICLGMRM